jgi:hypothetical protein
MANILNTGHILLSGESRTGLKIISESIAKRLPCGTEKYKRSICDDWRKWSNIQRHGQRKCINILTAGSLGFMMLSTSLYKFSFLFKLKS